jgi:hypothetical protein
VNYDKMIGGAHLSDAKARNAEDLLARLVASAFAADHPELFRAEPVASAGELPSAPLELP